MRGVMSWDLATDCDYENSLSLQRAVVRGNQEITEMEEVDAEMLSQESTHCYDSLLCSCLVCTLWII